MPHVFERLEIKNWRQFGRIDLEFHPDVTIVTGANGTGKTTLLTVLAQCLEDGLSLPQPMTPIVGRVSGGREYVPPIRIEPRTTTDEREEYFLGRVLLANGLQREVLAKVPTRPATQPLFDLVSEVPFSWKAQEARSPLGAFFASHRYGFRPEEVSSVSSESGNGSHKRKGNEPVRRLMTEMIYDPFGSKRGANYWIKQSLISWAIYGFGNEAVAAEPLLRENYTAFSNLLVDLLPKSAGFRRIIVRGMDVVVETDRGEFPFDALSGGMASIVEIAWTLFNLDVERSEPIAVIIDEAENHLHAAMQRELLPRLQRAFPNAQVVVSTHSPLIASSVRDAYVYALQYGEDGYVESVRLDLDDWAGTASDVLRDVLGLDATIPVWAEDRLRQMAEKLSRSTASPDLVDEVYDELKQDGLEEFAPRVVTNIGRDVPVIE